MVYKYKLIRVVCEGKIKGCDHCKDLPVPSEGYCKLCRRPLWRNIGDPCKTIIAYVNSDLKQGNSKRKIGVDVICKECNSITSI